MALPVELESNNHSVFLMHYHLVLVVKYRRRVITDAVSDRAREIFERIAPTYGITLEEWNHDVDHVHMLFRAQPKTELSKFICAYRSARCDRSRLGLCLYQTIFQMSNLKFSKQNN